MNPLLPLATAASFWLGAPSIPPQTTVELRVTSVDDGEAKLLEQALLRQIGDRLLEDGYRVVPAGAAASVRVWIHLGPDEATIETRGVGQQFERVADADPEIMALELQQLTTGLIDEVRPGDAPQVMAVLVEIVGDVGDPQVRTRLQTGLLERGFALTRLPERTDLRLCVLAEDDGLYVHTVEGPSACVRSESASVVGEAASVEITRELLLDAASESVERHLAESAIEPVSEPTRGSLTDELPPLDAALNSQTANEKQPKPLSIAVTASGGMFGRGGGVDPIAGLDLRAGRRYGIGGGLGVAIVPSRVDQLRVIESMPTASVDVRLPFASRGIAALGVFAGVHVHSYAYVDASAERGVRVGPSVGASARLGYLGSRGALLFGGVRAGWSGGRWIHLADGEPSWRRSGVVVGVELGAGWDFVVGRRG